ncbi:cryptochrome/photolyase family protein [Aciditerrimonas ferrireducens]|uniref:cryptochrome/photolyase family protein n=1 Tax=Aciditerrimonas ferrireducens TaxID=667306 RepID=UPI002005C219|nr:deoxyribodipyrimidine photo-lyase [Aciditerrimonas ferrireducens]MCK4176489.1 DNA photolyase family protein [Aciditerrimonas ferrireducens]
MSPARTPGRPVVFWFRRDLRVDDLPTLQAAAEAAGSAPVVPLFVLDPRAARGAGPNRRRFLAACLADLDRRLGGTLTLRRAPGQGGAEAVAEVVAQVAAEAGADVVLASGETTPYGRRRDRAVAERLAADGRRLVRQGTPYLVAPGRVRRADGQPFAVFSAFHRAWLQVPVEPPRPAPDLRTEGLASDVTVDDLLGGIDVLSAANDDAAALGALGLPAWWAGLPLGPAPRLPAAGSEAARARLRAFCDGPLAAYHRERDRPDLPSTSRLSADLHLGVLHPRTVLAEAQAAARGPALERFVAELAWREFYADVLWHRPEAAWSPLVLAGRFLRVERGPAAEARFAAWARGETGYPLVDAGMRQLLEEGWMHNRVRMVCASFLVNDLHLDWRLGARWFLWHLVDGDLASNNQGWQWVAGVGTDAAPYYRVFNPDRQAERFDPEGVYRRRYLGSAPARPPLVDHGVERADALARWRAAQAAAREGQASGEGPARGSPGR